VGLHQDVIDDALQRLRRYFGHPQH
jgi:hypothetical protein